MSTRNSPTSDYSQEGDYLGARRMPSMPGVGRQPHREELPAVGSGKSGIGRNWEKLGEIGRNWEKLGEMHTRHARCCTSWAPVL